MSYFWKKIAPEEWKKSSEKKQKKQVNRATKTKKRKINAKDYQCQNPFHFLKKHRDLSHKLPTPCYCSHVSRKATPPRFLDLRNMVTNNNTVSFMTREDLVRGEHDRGKNTRQHDTVRFIPPDYPSQHLIVYILYINPVFLLLNCIYLFSYVVPLCGTISSIVYSWYGCIIIVIFA